MIKSPFTPLSLAIVISLASCGGENKQQGSYQQEGLAQEETSAGSTDVPAEKKSVSTYDPNRGEGKWDANNLKIDDKIDDALAGQGKAVANTKCLSCHKTTDEKLVGPGWNGVTKRRSPAWIMNFITNPEPMIDKDPALQSQLEICLVRMPNQNLDDEAARQILEFMRQVDAGK